MKYPLHLQKLINVMRKLPGVGSKTAERYVFSLLSWPQNELREISSLIEEISLHLGCCPTCGCLVDASTCDFCDNTSRDTSVIAIISAQKQVYALEETGVYQGLYHVIGGVFSPLEGRGPSTLMIDKLKKRIESSSVKELIITLDATLESDATALFLKDQFKETPIKISRLAAGLPMGSSLEFIDGGTLAQSLKGRTIF